MAHIFRQVVALVVVSVLFVWTSGCHDATTLSVTVPELPATPRDRIVGVTTVEGETLTFDGEGRLSEDAVSGIVKGTPVVIPLPKAQRVFIVQKRANTWKTVGLVVGMVALVVVVAALVVAATKGSCPFVYSWDGTQYVFDAEPYGGAITRGLERADDTVLEHLRADGGRYRLLLTNEVFEIQYTNHLALRVADHSPGVRVVPDEKGTLHGVRSPERLLSARTADGRDLLRWLEAADERVFEPEPALGPNGETRDEVVLTFPRPAGATRARLIVGAGTSLFGSSMIREALKLRGRELTGWYAQLDASPAAAAALHDLVLREELWALKFDVEEPTGWEPRGALIGTGPLIVKERVVSLDVSRAAGETLRIRIRPPKGYWALNSFAIDYGADEPLIVTDVPLVEARDASGRDRRHALSAADDLYDEIPIGGEPVSLSFVAPPARPGMERTVVLHAQGWYRLDLATDGEPDRETLRRLETEPGFGVRFAAQRWEQRLSERHAIDSRR